MNPNRPIREIMTTDLVTVSPEASAKAIKAIFDRHDFHHLPVVGKGDRLIGIISKTDFFKLSYLLSLRTTGRTWTENEYQTLCAKDLMTKYPLSLDPEDTIGLAADIFLANKFHALPILEEERLVGLITTHDLLFFSYNSPIPEAEGDEEYI
ncbi:MAG: CBS domain-containing protein [Haliscomenobacter sp.]|nr:CBS domain-containing protein [Haliscomenobacter sp.]MBK8878337.1 CBS domain-containing protein [Haliscomenobacter sp.]